jgi:integrase
VMTTGTKIWRFRYSLNGKRQPLATIGDYRMISLRVARAKAQKYAELVAQGISPVATARRDRGAEAKAEVLREAAELYMATEMAGKSDEYRRTTRRALDKDVLPAIGGLPVKAVTAEHVVAICDRIKSRGSPKMALHTRNVIKRLYEYLIARQLATANPAEVVPARSIATFESRTRVLSGDEIGAMLHSIETSSIRRPLKIALHLLVLTMVRKSDLVESTWDEFDLDKALWRIDAARLKKDADQLVHLPQQAVTMLRELHRRPADREEHAESGREGARSRRRAFRSARLSANGGRTSARDDGARANGQNFSENATKRIARGQLARCRGSEANRTALGRLCRRPA